jgi:hypothetical protein
MSGLISGAVWDLKLSRSDREVLLALADYAEDDGTRVYPSVGRLAWKTDLSERQIQRALANLRERGLIVPVRYASGGKGHATEYRIDLSKGELKPAYAADQKGDVIVSPFEEVNGDVIVSPLPGSKGDISSKLSTKGDVIVSPFADELEEQRVTFPASKGDISTPKGDKAMTPDPSLRSSINPPEEKRARGAEFSTEKNEEPTASTREPELYDDEEEEAPVSFMGAAFRVDASTKEWAKGKVRENRVPLNVDLFEEKFINYYTRGAGKRQTSDDWNGRFAGWVLDEVGQLLGKNLRSRGPADNVPEWNQPSQAAPTVHVIPIRTKANGTGEQHHG